MSSRSRWHARAQPRILIKAVACLVSFPRTIPSRQSLLLLLPLPLARREKRGIKRDGSRTAWECVLLPPGGVPAKYETLAGVLVPAPLIDKAKCATRHCPFWPLIRCRPDPDDHCPTTMASLPYRHPACYPITESAHLFRAQKRKTSSSPAYPLVGICRAEAITPGNGVTWPCRADGLEWPAISPLAGIASLWWVTTQVLGDAQLNNSVHLRLPVKLHKASLCARVDKRRLRADRGCSRLASSRLRQSATYHSKHT